MGFPQTGQIAVENCEFSTFSTEFSTTLGGKAVRKHNTFLVYIGLFDGKRLFSDFFGMYNFNNEKKSRKKKGIRTPKNMVIIAMPLQ